MPVITLEAGHLSKEQKQLLAKELTEVAARITLIPGTGFYVFLKENSSENISVGGQLLSDKD